MQILASFQSAMKRINYCFNEIAKMNRDISTPTTNYLSFAPEISQNALRFEKSLLKVSIKVNIKVSKILVYSIYKHVKTIG